MSNARIAFVWIVAGALAARAVGSCARIAEVRAPVGNRELVLPAASRSTRTLAEWAPDLALVRASAPAAPCILWRGNGSSTVGEGAANDAASNILTYCEGAGSRLAPWAMRAAHLLALTEPRPKIALVDSRFGVLAASFEMNDSSAMVALAQRLERSVR